MYPFARMGFHLWKASRQPQLGYFDTHVSHHRVWPWDIDLWMELNNGRTLTLYDLGRLPLLLRNGLNKPTLKAGLYVTVAGVSVRYRKRIPPMAKVEMHTRLIGFDDRFIYFDQSMWLGGECANQVLVRNAIAKKGAGIVPPPDVARLIGIEVESPPLPDWVQNWIDAEATRIWPPVP